MTTPETENEKFSDSTVASTFDRKPAPVEHEVFPDAPEEAQPEEPEVYCTTAGNFDCALGIGPVQATVDPSFETHMKGFEQGYKEARAMVDYEARLARLSALHVAVDFLKAREKDAAKVVEAADAFVAFLEGKKGE